MAHLLIVELPGGNDTDILVAAIHQGHTFSFLTNGSQTAEYYQLMSKYSDGIIFSYHYEYSTLEAFKMACNMPEITLMKGKGREFASTPIGKVFEANKLDWNKPVFVVEAGADIVSKKGDNLAGSFWFCNSNIVETKDV